MALAITKDLKAVMPQELCDFDDLPAHQYLNVVVTKEHRAHVTRWPGREKNVHFWVELANGKAVGWNENPSIGWSFPVIKFPKN